VPRLLTLFTIALFATAHATTGGAQQRPTYRGTSDTVRVYVTVIDKDGRLVTTLAKEQFDVRDDGKPQPITVFDNSPEPIQLIVLLDVSSSMTGNLGLLRDASVTLFGELGQDDVARVGTFGKEIVLSREFTRNAETLQAALPRTILPDSPTPLWRAIDQAIGAFDTKSERRKVVLVLSDGKDADTIAFNHPVISQADVIDHARKNDVMVYGVGMRSRGPGPPMGGMAMGSMSDRLMADMPDPGLARTAEETGGGYVEVRPRDDLGAAFSQIARELHSQYLLGYEPPKRDGKTHKIAVHVSASGLEPRARKSYVAPKSD